MLRLVEDDTAAPLRPGARQCGWTWAFGQCPMGGPRDGAEMACVRRASRRVVCVGWQRAPCLDAICKCGRGRTGWIADMNCTKFQELAAAHALGALDRAEASRLEAIVAADPDAREELESFQDTVAALASVLPVRPPASDLRGRILERIDRTAQGGELENAGPPASAPARDRLPDLLIEWNGVSPIESSGITSDRFGELRWTPPGLIPSGRAGNHRPHGWFVAAGDGIESGQLDGHNIMDLVPTVCSWLGADLGVRRGRQRSNARRTQAR